MKTIFKALTLAACVMAITGCNQDEKKAEKSNNAVMTAEVYADKYCAGDFKGAAVLSEACTSEKASKGSDGDNCSEMQKANKVMADMKASKPGSCSPQIRF